MVCDDDNMQVEVVEIIDSDDEMEQPHFAKQPHGPVKTVEEFQSSLAAHLGHTMLTNHLVLVRALFTSVPPHLVRTALWEAEDCCCTKWWVDRIVLQPFYMVKVRA